MEGSEAGDVKPLRTVVLGLAHLHPRSYMPHFRALPGIEVVAAADPNRTLLNDFARDFSVRAYMDWRELLAKEPADLAVLFLPHADCPEAAVTCAKQGLHLLVEKPMAADTAGIRWMIEAAFEMRVVLSSPYVWRYHPVSRALKQLVLGGELGQVISGEGRCIAGRARRYVEAGAGWMLEKKRSGGGPMHNLGVHWIDLFRWLLEDEVTEAVGRTVRFFRDYDVEAGAMALLTFGQGVVVSLDIGYGVPTGYPDGRDLYIALRGTEGMASWHPSLSGSKQQLFVCSDACPSGRTIEFGIPLQPGYAGSWGRDFLADLIEAVRHRREPAVTGEDGLRALEAVESIYASDR